MGVSVLPVDSLPLYALGVAGANQDRCRCGINRVSLGVLERFCGSVRANLGRMTGIEESISASNVFKTVDSWNCSVVSVDADRITPEWSFLGDGDCWRD